jgi:hypothetical protein
MQNFAYWYIGHIVVHKDQEGDFLLKFMRGNGQDNLTFSWPQGGDAYSLCSWPVRISSNITAWKE